MIARSGSNKIVTWDTKRILLVTLLFILIPFLSITETKSQQAVTVGVDKIIMEPLTQSVPVIGRVVALESGTVSASVSGIVTGMDINVGDRVEKGEVIASLDLSRLVAKKVVLEAEVRETASQVELAIAALDLQRQKLRRIESLRSSVAFSKGLYEDTYQEVIVAENMVGVAFARNEGALANLALLEIDISSGKIRSPYGGVITRKYAAKGEYLAVGAAVVRMLGDENVEIEADVPVKLVAAIEPGVEIYVGFDNEEEYVTTVRALLPEENPSTRTRQVRFIPGSEVNLRSLAINQSVTIFLPIGENQNVITVHKDAIINKRGEAFVYVAIEGKAILRPVDLGISVGGRFEVLNGLMPGELTVIYGNERLRPGQDILIGNPS